MAKKNFSSGIDRVFRPTTSPLNPPEGDFEEVKEPEPEKPESNTPEPKPDVMVCYNLRYPKELKKRIKQYCVDHEGVDMKDIFTQGAVMYMERNKKHD